MNMILRRQHDGGDSDELHDCFFQSFIKLHDFWEFSNSASIFGSDFDGRGVTKQSLMI